MITAFKEKESSKLGKKMNSIVDTFAKVRKDLEEIVTGGNTEMKALDVKENEIKTEKTAVKCVIDAAKQNLELVPKFETIDTNTKK